MSASAPPARASVPVVTDATAASEAELAEAAALFLPPPPPPPAAAAAAAAAGGGLVFARCGGGVNNKLYTVAESAAAAPAHVLRIYNNGNNSRRVRYEHEVLRQLQGARAEALRAACGAQVPRPMPVLRGSGGGGGGGATFAPISTGAEACCFPLIAGAPPPLSAARSIGRATAALVAVMADMRVDEAVFGHPNPLYRNIYDSHWKMSAGLFAEVVSGPEFAEPSVRAAMDELVAGIARAEALIARVLAEGGLPEQQIHADLHFDNVLVTEDGSVSAILDFEFSACDWRVMELVVGLSKYAGLAEPEAHVEAFAAGYAEAGGRLTAREIELVPDLVVLRVLSNVVYFAGRAAAGEDSIAPLTGRAAVYAKRCRWLLEQRAWLVGALAGLRE